MRMTRIELHGYKRMLNTGCNVDADLIALVGPNEAGKTTVLEALEWFSSGAELNDRKVNRTIDPELSGPVVTAVFALEATDQEAMTDVETDVRPTTVRFSRYQDGHAEIDFSPSLTRRPTVRTSVLEMISDPTLAGRVEATQAAEVLPQAIDLAESGKEWGEGDRRAVEALVHWLELPITESPNDAAAAGTTEAEPKELPAPEPDLAAARLLKDWRDQMGQVPPETMAGESLRGRVPQFLMFSEADRTLGFEHDLRPRTINQGGKSVRVPSEDVENPDGGLVNLLKLGGTNIREIYELVQRGVPERTSRHARGVNKRLNEAIAPYWRQRNLKVDLDVSDATLRVFIEDGEDTARFTDRSDGLRTFVALIAFLAHHASELPPVLLIDEADTHLHYDAQADLINFLQVLPSRTIYTTHSPGCLPLDLGTGVRVVRPDPEKAISELRNNFWENGQAGFSPLLFAMGAGAAAFSALRAAVFTEGASDMMLLPTLIREATGERSLSYQIVPGLASIHPEHLGDAEFAAVRVAYLLDGDSGGDQHQQDLERAGVPTDRILRFDEGVATEDLIAPGAYLDAVNGVLADSNRPERVTHEDLESQLEQAVTIAKAVESVLGGHRNAPSKVAVAGRLLRHDSGIPLTPAAQKLLVTRHADLMALLEEPERPVRLN